MTMFRTNVLKEPLLHFLLLGCALFILDQQVSDADFDSDNQITVDRERLLDFVQFRSRNNDIERLNIALDGLSNTQREDLIDDYVQEEVLYREAKALGLNQEDAAFRQQLIRKIRYLIRSSVREPVTPTEADLREYYDQNKSNYDEPQKRTFTHVFFGVEKRTFDEAEGLALESMETLNRKHIPFERAGQFGEHFLYNKNYVKQDAEFIASHFGSDFKDTLFGLPEKPQGWQGPYQSRHGFHVLLITEILPAYSPEFSEVKPQLVQAVTRIRENQEFDKIVTTMKESYDIKVVNELLKPSGQVGAL